MFNLPFFGNVVAWSSTSFVLGSRLNVQRTLSSSSILAAAHQMCWTVTWTWPECYLDGLSIKATVTLGRWCKRGCDCWWWLTKNMGSAGQEGAAQGLQSWRSETFRKPGDEWAAPLGWHHSEVRGRQSSKPAERLNINDILNQGRTARALMCTLLVRRLFMNCCKQLLRGRAGKHTDLVFRISS